MLLRKLTSSICLLSCFALLIPLCSVVRAKDLIDKMVHLNIFKAFRCQFHCVQTLEAHGLPQESLDVFREQYDTIASKYVDTSEDDVSSGDGESTD